METIKYVHFSEEPDTDSELVYNAEVSDLIRSLLAALGEDPQREGLERTPERVARMYVELLAGYHVNLESLVNSAVFDSAYQDIVLVKDIEFYSLCEHHMLPFYGKAHVAYLPSGKIIGLSKIPRVVEMFARRLQVQERMTEQIAATIQDILQPRGVAVLVEGSHMCAMMRGVKKTGAAMVTQIMLGAFKEDKELRDRFLAGIHGGAHPAGTDLPHSGY
jgi:GTP cyclohydrolase IA